MLLQLVSFLLPVAAVSGWVIGRKSNLPSLPSRQVSLLNKDYYAGLNYLLNEQPDKAVDAFIGGLEANPDTIETTLALGNFFRRRGEVDKAIRVHQNLIARPNLTSYQRNQGLLELGQDYMRAGVYDRAENLFLELINTKGEQLELSLKHLIDIYEREKDWEKAINVAKRFQLEFGVYKGKEIAQYYCELAQLSLAKGDLREAKKYLKVSLNMDRHCVRASLLLGDVEVQQGKYKAALRTYKRIQYQDSSLIPEILLPIKRCYQALNTMDDFQDYLGYLLIYYPSTHIILANAESIKLQGGSERASEFLVDHMQKQPSIRGIKHFIDFHLSCGSEINQDLKVLSLFIDRLLEKKPSYRCTKCGFSTKPLHWQCPSCRHWVSLKPIEAIEGEI